MCANKNALGSFATNEISTFPIDFPLICSPIVLIICSDVRQRGASCRSARSASACLRRALATSVSSCALAFGLAADEHKMRQLFDESSKHVQVFASLDCIIF